MLWRIYKKIRGQKKYREIDPDEILLDASNLPQFDRSQFEGRIASPISRRALAALGGVGCILASIVLFQLSNMQIAEGAEWQDASEDNRLHHSIIFTERGVIYDRNGIPLAWNTISTDEELGTLYPLRNYATSTGLGHVLGYTSPPKADKSGNFYQTEHVGLTGAEQAFDTLLRGKNGNKIVEMSAAGEVASESVLAPPVEGDSITLSLDAEVTDILARSIGTLAERNPYQGGAGIVMDVHTGEIIAMTSYPEYHGSVFTGATEDKNQKTYIQSLTNDSRRPFLHRAIAGLYTPGSIVKPFLAIGALMEGVVTPSDVIVSEGAIRVPNPYDPSKPTIFRDWRAHGATDMERAIAVSSDVYFYTIGGGFGGRRGLGITKIEKYLHMFGVGQPTGIVLSGEEGGFIPNPAWKEKMYPEDPTWRLGDTYNTSIGQYSMQVTPLEMVRAAAALANGGVLLTPTILKGQSAARNTLDIPQEHLEVAKRGMRKAVTEGTAGALIFSDFPVAGKTGTAEVGVHKEFVNSWIMGFFPYENPRYAFVIIMERGKAGSPQGAPYAMRVFLDGLRAEAPEYTR